MRSLLGLFLVLTVLAPSFGFSQVAVNSSDVFATGYVPKNYVKNPMALKNVQNVTVSSAAVLRDTTTKLDNIASFTCNTSATSGYCEWDTNTVRSPDDVGQCEVSAWYNGDASLLSLQAWDGTSAASLPLTTVTTWTQAVFPVPCSATLKARITQTTAGTTPAVNTGRMYAGRTTRVGSTQLTTEPVSYTPTFTGFGTVAGVDVKSYRDGGDLIIYGIFQVGTTTAVQATISLGFGGVNGGVTVASSVGAGGVVAGRYTTTSSNVAGVTITGGGDSVFRFGPESSTTAGYSYALGTAIPSSAYVTFSFRLPIQGWAAQSIVMPDAQGLSWSGYHDGTCSWSRSSSTFGDPAADAVCGFTERTNRNFGTVTSVLSGSDKLPGITFTPRVSGRYFVCFNTAATGGATQYTATGIQLVDGSGNVVTMTSRQMPSTFDEVGAMGSCGIANLSAGAAATLKLQTRNSAVGNIIIGPPTSVMDTVTWSIFNIDQPVSAILANSVSTGTANGERLERLRFAAPSAGACAVSKESADWINGNGTSSGTGLCSFTFNSGIFSSAPVCTVSADGAAGGTSCRLEGDPSSSAVGVYCMTTSTGGASSQPGNLICMGPR